MKLPFPPFFPKRWRSPRGFLDILVAVSIILAVVAGAGAFVWFLAGSNRIEVINDAGPAGPVSPITGLPCPDPDGRPVAVMLASDQVARPLSGIAQAELVLEMPVTPDGITRMMAVFQCVQPNEIGSIRSARMDFLGLAAGWDVIYAHWGGERDALALLNKGVLDNLDALAYEGTVFYRDTKIAPPHNGFTTITRLRTKAEELGYAASGSYVFWPHRSGPAPRRSLVSTVQEFTIDYPAPMNVRWTYDEKTNRWTRTRGTEGETDALDGTIVRAGAVIVMETSSVFLREQYISVRTLGEGRATLYQDGMRRTVRWSRPDDSAPLSFIDDAGQPVALATGPVWISIITTAP